MSFFPTDHSFVSFTPWYTEHYVNENKTNSHTPKKIIRLKVAFTAPKLEVEVSREWHCYSWHCLQPQTFSCSCLPSAWWGLWMDNNSDTGGQDSSLLQLFLSSSTVCHSIGNVGSDMCVEGGEWRWSLVSTLIFSTILHNKNFTDFTQFLLKLKLQ